jgi:LDH2 family malate/lactate/ureidoglycolate dehydrogenase
MEGEAMKVSVREVFQLSERCFSAAGFAEGPAQANAETMWWTETYRGSGLTTLHGLLDELFELDRTQLALRDRSSMVSVIDSNDQPSLISSTPALDLSCTRAKQHGVGIAYSTISHHDNTLPTLGHIAHKAAERGLLSIVLSANSEAESATIVGAPDYPQPRIIELELAAPSVSYTELLNVIRTDLHYQHHSPLIQAFFKGSEDTHRSAADERLVDRLLHRATKPARDHRSEVDPGFVSICIKPTHPLRSESIRPLVDRFLDDQEAMFTTVFHPQRIQDRTETLLHEGVEIDRDVWRDIFEFSSGVLAPPFEGSQRGAGFDLNE